MKATTGVQDYFRRNRAPATYAIIGVALAVFVLSWLTQGTLGMPLMFWVDGSHPWGVLTYPFSSTGNGLGLFWFLLALYWLFWVGTSAEGDLGTPKFVAFFFVASILAAAFIWLGIALLGLAARGPVLGGLELPIAALTVAWGVRHLHESILLFAVIPVPGWLLAWLTVALTLFGFGSMFGAPVMGVFACLHLGAAWLFASNRIPALEYGRGSSRERQLKATERMNKPYYEDVRKREQERADRERLRKLFEGSMGDDPEAKP